MIRSLFSGVSGILANQTRMDVIGNNIANANTVGFKASRALFSDLLSQTIIAATAPSESRGGTGPGQVGYGVQVASIDPDYRQGPIRQTGRSADVAIDGTGFLTLTDGQALYYTRDGALGLDAEGNLIHLASGLRLVSAERDPATGQMSSAPVPANSIRIPVGQISLSRPTTEAVLGGNLNAGLTTGQSAQAMLRVFDSLGVPHEVTVQFTRTASPSVWDVTATSPDGTVLVGAGSAQVTFDANGVPQQTALPVELTLTNPGGATSPLTFNLDVGLIRQLADETTLSQRSQDGLPPGMLSGFTISQDGAVNGIFDNGMVTPLTYLALAQFSNPNGLTVRGQNVLAEGVNSGDAVFGLPGTGGLGTVRGGALESSTVELAQEFAEMIVTQRAFQASSRLITVSDQLLQDLMSITR